MNREGQEIIPVGELTTESSTSVSGILVQLDTSPVAQPTGGGGCSTVSQTINWLVKQKG